MELHMYNRHLTILLFQLLIRMGTLYHGHLQVKKVLKVLENLLHMLLKLQQIQLLLKHWKWV